MNAHQLENDKIKLIRWISELKDAAIIDKIKSIMISELSEDEKKAIDEAIQSIEIRGTLSHNQVMEETEKLYPDLFKK